MVKIYVVCQDEEPLKVFFSKVEAHTWAEAKFGSRQDGICVDGVSVVAYVPAVSV